MKQTAFLLLPMAIIIFSCSSDSKSEDKNTTEKNVDTSLISLFNSIKPTSQYFEVSNNSDTILLGAKGTTLTIEAKSFVDESGQVSVKVKVELIETFDLADMIGCGLSTTSTNEVLETDGMIYINAVSESGKTLKLNTGKEIFIETPSSGNLSNIEVFEGAFDQDKIINWNKKNETEKFLTPVPLKELSFYAPVSYRTHNMPGQQAAPQPKGLSSNKAASTNQTVVADTAIRTDSIKGYCGIAENLLKPLYDDKFNNTLIATKEFETRVFYIHKSCNASLIKLYVSNLDKNLWEIDSV